jgi:hypothetical protein
MRVPSYLKGRGLRKRGLLLLNRAIGRVPYCFRLFGIPTGFAEFGDFPNTIVYQPHALPRPCFKTVCKRSPPTITLSSAPRCLKGGGLISMTDGIARKNGGVFTSTGELVVSRDNVYEFVTKSLLSTSPTLFPRINVADEPVAMLSTSAFNYFHWMHDVLPKIHLLEKAGRGDIKLYLNIENDVQRETLRLLRIRSERIINSADHEFIAAKELVIPNFVGREGACRVLGRQFRGGRQEIIMGNVNGWVNAAVWTCSFLRECFLETMNRTPNGLRICISRRDASKKRGIKAEEAFTERIQSYGFKTITLTGMKFSEQVDLFRNAEVVLAPHGAGLANIVFCAPGARCLELFSPTYVSDLYAVLSQAVGVRYYYLVGTREGQWKEKRSNEELELDLTELDELFELAGLQPTFG